MRIKKIKKIFNELIDSVSQKIKEIRRNYYEIENERKLFTPKLKGIEKNLLELGQNLFELKKIL